MERSGIPIKSNTEYAAITAAGIVLLHFLVAPLLAILGIVLFLMLGICEIPCIIVALATHHSAIAPMVVLGALGGIVWLWWSWRVCKKLWGRFVRTTRYRYVKGYEGPLPKKPRRQRTDTWGNPLSGPGQSAPSDASSPQTQQRSTHT